MVIFKKKEEEQKTVVGGHELALSHLDKIFWKEEKYTKGDVIEYYREVASTILPYLKDRPMVMRRNPHGISEEGFFQKDTSDMHLPNWIKTVKIQHDKGIVRYLLVQDEASLLYVANLGCIELNPFNSRLKHLDNPDYLIWDLDPVEIEFEHVVEVAHVIHDILEKAHIKSYCKTSGGRGLHIYIPLGAKYTYEHARTFGQVIAMLVNEKLPEITSLERMPAKRKGKVYIDVLQNEYSKTIAAPYCIRPKPHAPVATPLKWTEVKKGLSPEKFNIKTTPTRIKRLGDLFQPVLGPGIDLEKALNTISIQHH